MDNLYNQKVINANNVFGDYFLDAKTLFVFCFNALPSLSYIGQVDGEKAFAAFKDKFSRLIAKIHQYDIFASSSKKYEFDTVIAVLNDQCLVEFYGTYCEIWHNGEQPALVEEITALISQFKQRQRKRPLEINLIVENRNTMQLKAMEIKRAPLDVDLFYEEGFKDTDALIRKKLNQKDGKGIVLLHGLPGTGKTTYLRYLIGKIKKRVLFLSPAIAGNLTNPDFIQLLIDNPNTVLIIEDAENIIMDRKINPGSTVSGLLNISDGLLADFLNVQLICTFNSPLTLIDNALMRKGRLIAKHEFGKLNAERAQRLSRHFGFDSVISKPMTIAEIANQHEKEQVMTQMETIGFKRNVIQN